MASLAAGVISVQAATVSGVVKEGDSTGAPVAGAIVTLASSGGGGGGSTLRDTTDETGAYSFGSVGIGTRQARASKTGYLNSALSTIGITDSTAAYIQNLFLVSTSIRATVSGTVTDSAAGTPLTGAKVLLRIGTGAGASIRDSVTTGTSGAYSFDTVPAGAFTLVASATGYISRNTTGNITSATPPAIDIKLVKILYGSITGTVTDSAAGTALAGAKVYLRTTGGGGGGTILDSTVTAASGSYTIANVQTGIARSLRVQDSEFITKNTTITLTDTTATNVNVQLVKILFGSITGTVTDSAAATALAGAKVYLRTTGGGGGGTILDSTVTAASGSYTIANVQTGIARSLRVQDSGFTTKNTTITLTDTAATTVNVQLVKILFGSITGTVTDSVAGTAIAGAKVYLRTTGGGGGTILDSAVTAASGSYTITNVQTGIARMVRAQAAGFITKNATVTLTDTAALTVNFALRTSAIAIASRSAQGISTAFDVGISRAGVIRLSNCNDAGTFTLFDVNGRLLYRAALQAHTPSLALPAHFAKSGNAYIVNVTHNNAVYRKQIVMP